jgi:hypothetical protein
MDSEQLRAIRSHSVDVLKNIYQASIPAHLAPLGTFWESYSDSKEKLATGFRACLATWAASGKKIVPTEFQLRATIAVMSGQDALIDVGTGYGKTLCMIIPCLLDAPGTISIIISPLKRLQAVQVLEFERYGIRTVAINEDTPNDPELWKVWYSTYSSDEFYTICARKFAKEDSLLLLFSQNSSRQWLATYLGLRDLSVKIDISESGSDVFMSTRPILSILLDVDYITWLLFVPS